MAPAPIERPVIGVCSRPDDGAEHTVICAAYADRIVEAGGIPVALPYHPEAQELADCLAQRLDGILFTGGCDPAPEVFEKAYEGAGTHPLEAPMAQRDSFEGALAQAAWNHDVPAFGICRGLQVMNVVRGGTLVRDVTEQEWWNPQIPVGHVQAGPYDRCVHEVVIEPNSQLYKLMGTLELPVNSMHHLAVAKVAPGAHVVARAADGTPEAVEFPGRSFFFGVQWHPEYLDAHRPLFRAFVGAATVRRRRTMATYQRTMAQEDDGR